MSILPLEFLGTLDYFIFAILGAIGPIGFYSSAKEKRKQEVINHLPDFLRDIASSTSSGMTIYDSIRAASEGDYGGLTAELQMMTAQLSWGIPISQALSNFAKRINTDEMKRLSLTINKALEIGGNTASVFTAAAKEIEQIKRIEIQRRTEMSMYSIVIFISFFVFLAVIIVINTTIFAAIYDLGAQMGGASIGGMQIANVDPSAVSNMLFTFVFVQALGGGLLGGFMMEGKLSSGVKQAFVLVLISFFIYKFFF